MNTQGWLTYVIAFAGGVGLVWAWQKRSSLATKRPAPAGSQPVMPAGMALGHASSGAGGNGRPDSQIPIRAYEQIVALTGTQTLIDTIEQRTKFSHAAFNADCRPVLQSLAEYVQMLPASEAHHHAQPGGLWVHMLEVANAALAIRSGMELPRGVGTEDRKRLEHRCTYMVLLGSLMHDLGKPVADLRITLYGADFRLGRPWPALAGQMVDASHYRVEFAPQSERDYGAHQRLPAILMQRFVPDTSMQWMGAEPGLLGELVKYLSGEGGPSKEGSKDGSFLHEIVSKADASSVKQNLMNGPRTRFATAKVVPLIERLLGGLRRMLAQGGLLPLNKPGAVGWVYDDSVWFVCARLADDLRAYLRDNESGDGIPGPDKNDRIFDEFEDYGACMPNPDGSGAVWKVQVELDDSGWASPHLTVLRFDLKALYRDPAAYPGAINGRIKVIGGAAKAIAKPLQAAAVSAPQSSAPASSSSQAPSQPAKAMPAAAAGPAGGQSLPGPVALSPVPVVQPVASVVAQPSAKVPSMPEPVAAPAVRVDAIPGSGTVRFSSIADIPDDEPDEVMQDNSGQPQSQLTDEVAHPAVIGHSVAEPVVELSQTRQGLDQQSQYLSEADQANVRALHQEAVSVGQAPAAVTGKTLITRDLPIAAPQQPYEKPHKGPKPSKDATPAAIAFLRWVQEKVSNGQLKYNEPNAVVHFCAEGMLLLSPEIFRRFLTEHQDVQDGPVAALKVSHPDKMMQRLQNEVAKSPYTQRNGDENLHYYAFTKHEGGVSAASAYFLVPQPQLLFNPVPALNSRILKTAKPVRQAKKLKPVGTNIGGSA